ncbi:MAG: hypothetical protein HZA53_18695 [Planctomycetes bacterium]|nr:hypothetical protein [Planctomycetota bacterium]
MVAARLQAAVDFLREAVYRSRATQALETFLAQGAAPKLGQCGLGERAAVVLDLDARGRELFERVWSAELGDDELARIRGVMRRWVETQDALDRDRNHFLKAFRRAHGFERARYTPEQTTEFERGLADLARIEDERQRAAASELLGS